MPHGDVRKPKKGTRRTPQPRKTLKDVARGLPAPSRRPPLRDSLPSSPAKPLKDVVRSLPTPSPRKQMARREKQLNPTKPPGGGQAVRNAPVKQRPRPPAKPRKRKSVR